MMSARPPVAALVAGLTCLLAANVVSAQVAPAAEATAAKVPAERAIAAKANAAKANAAKGDTVDAPSPATATASDGPILTLDDVTLSARINLEARDNALSALLLYTFRTRRAGRIRWTAKRPLVLPLLVPTVRGEPVDRGVIPKAARHVQTKSGDKVKVEQRGGGMVLIGELVSGKPVDIRVSYPIAAVDQEVELGFRGVVGETSLAIAAVGMAPVRMRLQSDRTARIAEHHEGEERYAALSLTRPLQRGEVAVIRAMDLPTAPTWPGRTLAGMAVLIAIGIGATFFRRREAADEVDRP